MLVSALLYMVPAIIELKDAWVDHAEFMKDQDLNKTKDPIYRLQFPPLSDDQKAERIKNMKESKIELGPVILLFISGNIRIV